MAIFGCLVRKNAKRSKGDSIGSGVWLGMWLFGSIGWKLRPPARMTEGEKFSGRRKKEKSEDEAEVKDCVWFQEK